MEYYLAVLLFSAVAAATPGPNNMMLMASGVNHGVRKSLPHYVGCVLGFALMLAVLGIGLASVFLNYPIIHLVLKYIGISYMLFLAWKIANAGNPKANASLKKPMTFVQAVLFQWVNPKGILFAVSVIAAFTTQETLIANLVFIVVANIFIGATSLGIWLILGSAMQRLIQSNRQVLIFNISMASLLALSVIPILTMEFGYA